METDRLVQLDHLPRGPCNIYSGGLGSRDMGPSQRERPKKYGLQNILVDQALEQPCSLPLRQAGSDVAGPVA